jgi:threonine synthase
MPRMSFVTYLESAIDGTKLPAERLQTMHNDRPLWVRYDLDAVRKSICSEALAARPSGMWRYRELLPIGNDADIVSLGESATPLLAIPKLGETLGLSDFHIKDESLLPTASFKSRGRAMAVSMARRFGVTRVAAPTAGNAGGALAAYRARAGMEVFIFMPADTPLANQWECVDAGARVYLVDGLFSDCGRIVRQGREPMGWFDMATLKEPYRIGGKKTMGLELADQLGWALPDAILYPTGGGTGLIGMWKAFNELRELGWLRARTGAAGDVEFPRMISVQSDGCAPIARAFANGEGFAHPWENARTAALGIRVPSAVGDFMILDAIRESGGCAFAVPEGEIEPARRHAAALTGIAICPECAACLAAVPRLLRDGLLKKGEKVVLFNTASQIKYVASQGPVLPLLGGNTPIDFMAL